MAVNRFFKYDPQPYVSTYVPLPLEKLYAIGKDIDEQQEQKKKAQADALDLASKINIQGTVNYYTPGQGTGQGVYDLGKINQKKNEELADISRQTEQLADEYYTKGMDRNTFNIKMNQLTTKAKETYNKYKAYEGLAQGLKEQQKLYGEAKHYGLNPAYAESALAAGTDLVRSIESGAIPSDYTPVAIAPEYKRSEELTKIGGQLEETFMGQGIDELGKYYRDYKIHGVTEPRIQNLVNNYWSDSDAKKYSDMEYKDYIQRGGELKPQQITVGLNKDNKPIKKELSGYELWNHINKSDFTGQLIALKAHQKYEGSARISPDYIKSLKQKTEQPEGGVPFQHYPGELKPNKEIESTELIPGVKTKDLFNVDKNGKISWKSEPTYTSRFQNELAQSPIIAKAKQEKINEVTRALTSKWIGTPFEKILKEKGFTDATQAYVKALSESVNKDTFTTELKNVDKEALTMEIANNIPPNSTSFVSATGDLLDLENAAKSYGLSINNKDFAQMDKTKEGWAKGKEGIQVTKLSTPVGGYIMKIRDSSGKEAEIPVQSSYEMQTQLKPINELYNNMSKGTIGEFILSDGRKANSMFNEDDKGNITYETRVYDKLNENQIQRVYNVIKAQFDKLPDSIKKSVTYDSSIVKKILEKTNPGLEINIDKNGKITFNKYISPAEFSDEKTEQLINSGYLPKEKYYKEKEDVLNFNIE